MPHTWDPDTYLQFADDRARPFLDLLARVGASAPRTVADLGAGPGTLTALLARRWPEATVTAVDASPEMVARAREVPGIDALLADLRTWEPPTPVDVLVTNAALQWVPGHLDLLGPLLGRVAPGGWFAMQVPGNFAEPSHVLRTRLAADPRFAPHLADVAVPSSHDPATYLEALEAAGAEADVWETTYLHVLRGQDPVLRWVLGTGVRPTVQALPDPLRARFVDEYGELLREAYPPRADGSVILPFRRIFAVARRP
ncbi:trans-aconitate 2-methyltransferase [Brachybacterium sp. AOP25-B2-12]|uniref:trans-aconitate 2-methyltransferase n=1 Tax=Brachybacterium sp. AOP25-B2-12 TaxID=3457710 RepID=UPI0040343F2E